jgi:NADPH2:quinone reductase
VLVAGGAGAVGHYAIELAVRAGATVVATASTPEKADLARQAGAAHVVNYRDEDAADQIRAAAGDVDRVIELALGANLATDLAVTRSGASIACYAAEPSDPVIPVRACMTANVSMRFVLLYGVPVTELDRAAADITAALADRALTELPVHPCPLADITAAHQAAEAGVTGKIIVVPS